MMRKCCVQLIAQSLRCSRSRSRSRSMLIPDNNQLLRDPCSEAASRVLCQTATFRSDISIDQLYPNSNSNFLRNSTVQRPAADVEENFSGYIPVEELEISSSKSSGPGGQHVNKVNSKVEIRFHLKSASWIPDWIKPRLAAQEDNRITKDGYLVIRSDMTRRQILNQADCMNKLRKMIYSASVLPKELTKEEITLKESRIARAKASVLREKRNRSQVKRSRSMPES